MEFEEMDKQYSWTPIFKKDYKVFIKPGTIIKRIYNAYKQIIEVTSKPRTLPSRVSMGLNLLIFDYTYPDEKIYSNIFYVDDLFNGRVFVAICKFSSSEQLPEELFEI